MYNCTDHAWAIDFVSDRTGSGKPLKILTVLDEYTREALAIEVRAKMGQAEVTKVLTRLIAQRGAPEFVRSDNGAEFSAQIAKEALRSQGVEVALIAPGSPWQNGKNERFNGSLSQEVLSKEVWGNLLDAKVVCQQWKQVYHTIRPHGLLGLMTPSEYAKKAFEMGEWHRQLLPQMLAA